MLEAGRSSGLCRAGGARLSHPLCRAGDWGAHFRPRCRSVVVICGSFPPEERRICRVRGDVGEGTANRSCCFLGRGLSKYGVLPVHVGSHGETGFPGHVFFGCRVLESRRGMVRTGGIRSASARKKGGALADTAPDQVLLSEDQAFFSGRKEARMPRARKPTTTLRETMAGRWMTPATSSSILAPMKARMAMTDFSR